MARDVRCRAAGNDFEEVYLGFEVLAFRNAQLFALGVLVLTSLVAGYFPAREAARANPLDALRRE